MFIATSTISPMFPLGTVVLPGAPLTLRIFEPRYRAMLDDVLDADRRFGQVLIDRGSEVGGGDVRAAVGCRVVILDLDLLPDGSAGVGCLGIERLRVLEWVPDDPYPAARVEPWPDEVSPDDPLKAEPTTRIAAARTRVDAHFDAHGWPNRLSPDSPTPPPAVSDWTYQLALALDPNPFDASSILAAPSRADRAERVAELLDERIEMIELTRRDQRPDGSP